MGRPYRLGLDLGSTSLGWVIYFLNEERQPVEFGPIGVRIFSDGRDTDGNSLNVDRRLARSQRRRRLRLRHRKLRLLKLLISAGLLPTDIEQRRALAALDPYEIRARGCEKELTLFEIGRLLLHLNQRRGFKSSRKGGSDEDSGRKLKGRMCALDVELERSGLTLGAFLYQKLKEEEELLKAGKLGHMRGIRARPAFGFYPRRKHYDAEFKKIFDVQRKFHPELSEALEERIYRRIFWQRDLKPPIVGKCQFYPDEPRCPRALPSYQLFRILKVISDLKVIGIDGISRFLTKEEQRIVRDALLRRKEASFTTIRDLLDFGPEILFNLESERRDKLKGDSTGYLLKGKKYFKEKWFTMPLKKQDELVVLLLENDDPDLLIEQLKTIPNVPNDLALVLAELYEDDFESSYAPVSKRFLDQVIPLMLNEGISEFAAVKRIGLHHSDFRPDTILSKLPYYGHVLRSSVVGGDGFSKDEERKIGKYPNPTVHVALRQLQKVVNAIIDEFGLPTQIIIELARELPMSAVKKKSYEKELNKRTKEREKAVIELKKEFPSVKLSRDAINRYLLWLELGADHLCPYSGKRIAFADILNGDLIQIDHIIPESDSQDDSLANSVLCYVSANRAKLNGAPYEAFGKNNVSGYDYLEILARVSSFPANKRWRFQVDARERFEENRNFTPRDLAGSQTASRLARRYLQAVCEDVRTVKGGETAYFRRMLGLGTLLTPDGIKKSARKDHRHHAVDAAVVGLITEKFRQRARQIILNHERGTNIEPWETFRRDLNLALSEITVSYRPDHNPQCKLFTDTNYGVLVPRTEEEKEFNLVYRKSIESLTEPMIRDKVRNPRLRTKLIALLDTLSRDEGGKISKKELSKVLAKFGADNGIKTVRILHKDSGGVTVHHPKKEPRFVKYMSGEEQYAVDVWRRPDGELFFAGVAPHEALSGSGRPNGLHPTARKEMRIRKQDMIRYLDGNRTKTGRVIGLRPSLDNQLIVVADHRSAGKQAELNPSYLKFSQFRDKEVRLISVDILGKVLDRGPFL